MGLGVALGAANRSFLDTTRQLREQEWQDEQRQQIRDQQARDEAIRRTYEQTVAPGQEIQPVMVNGASVDMSPEQAAIYRQAALNPATQDENGVSSVGAIGPRRTQTQTGYLNALSAGLRGLDPKESIALMGTAKQMEATDLNLEAQRAAAQELKNTQAVLWLARNKDNLSDLEFAQYVGNVLNNGKDDGRKAEVRVGENGEVQMWELTPDGKQRLVPNNGNRDEQIGHLMKYLNLNTYEKSIDRAREDKKTDRQFALEDRKLGITEAYHTGMLGLEGRKLDLQAPLWKAQEDWYLRRGDGTGGAGKYDPTTNKDYAPAVEAVNNSILAYQDALATKDADKINTARRAADAAQVRLANIMRKPMALGKNGDVSTKDAEDELAAKMYAAGRSPEEVRAALDDMRSRHGRPSTTYQGYGMDPASGSFFGGRAPGAQAAPAPAAPPVAIQRYGLPSDAGPADPLAAMRRQGSVQAAVTELEARVRQAAISGDVDAMRLYQQQLEQVRGAR